MPLLFVIGLSACSAWLTVEAAEGLLKLLDKADEARIRRILEIDRLRSRVINVELELMKQERRRREPRKRA